MVYKLELLKCTKFATEFFTFFVTELYEIFFFCYNLKIKNFNEVLYIYTKGILILLKSLKFIFTKNNYLQFFIYIYLSILFYTEFLLTAHVKFYNIFILYEYYNLNKITVVDVPFFFPFLSKSLS